MNSIQNKTIVVTGASKGIGKGVAKIFSDQGGKVMIVARSEDEGRRAVEELNRSGGTAEFFRADVTVKTELDRMAQYTVQCFGGIDVLCCNAGVFPSAALGDMTEAQWDTVIDVNLKGMFLTVSACLPYLKQSKAGRIVLTSSITGPHTGYPGWSHYGATKSGMLGFMRTAAIELACDGITINAVLPGNIITEGLQGLGDDYLKTMAASIPLKRLGTPQDIGYAMAFLASEEAGFITGQTLVVDGGQILPESIEALNA